MTYRDTCQCSVCADERYDDEAMAIAHMDSEDDLRNFLLDVASHADTAQHIINILDGFKRQEQDAETYLSSLIQHRERRIETQLDEHYEMESIFGR